MRGAEKSDCTPFAPPEDWHEPTEQDTEHYRVIVQDPGPGYVHVVTEQEIRERLAQMPAEVLRPLDVVQLSRMTRKKTQHALLWYAMGSNAVPVPN